MKKMFALMLISLGLLVSCGGGKDGGSSSGLSGEVIIDGSSTVAPITEAVAEEFREVEPDVNVSVGISGTGGGFKKFTVGELDISNASREMKPEEKALSEKNKIEFTEIQVGKDGITMVVNKENTWAQDITTEEIKNMTLWELMNAYSAKLGVSQYQDTFSIALVAGDKDNNLRDKA
mgnify:CR=1 FL=1